MNDKEFELWKSNKNTTQNVISKFVATLPFCDKKLKPLSDLQVDKLMWILYQCYKNKKPPLYVWKEYKNFLYALVNHKLRHASHSTIKDLYGFESVWDGQWNNDQFSKHYKKQKKYPVIQAYDTNKCLCGVCIKERYYCFSNKLKITFVIGSTCAGHTKNARRCRVCCKFSKYMRKEGRYADICKICQRFKT